jgi:hypothetical protein
MNNFYNPNSVNYPKRGYVTYFIAMLAMHRTSLEGSFGDFDRRRKVKEEIAEEDIVINFDPDKERSIKWLKDHGFDKLVRSVGPL